MVETKRRSFLKIMGALISAPVATPVAKLLPEGETVSATLPATQEVLSPAATDSIRTIVSIAVQTKKLEDTVQATLKIIPNTADNDKTSVLQRVLPIIFEKTIPVLKALQKEKQQFLSTVEGRRELACDMNKIAELHNLLDWVIAEEEGSRAKFLASELGGNIIETYSARQEEFKKAIRAELYPFRVKFRCNDYEELKRLAEDYSHNCEEDMFKPEKISSHSPSAWHHVNKDISKIFIELHKQLGINSSLFHEAQRQFSDLAMLILQNTLTPDSSIGNHDAYLHYYLRYNDAFDDSGNPIVIPNFFAGFHNPRQIANYELHKQTIPLSALVDLNAWYRLFPTSAFAGARDTYPVLAHRVPLIPGLSRQDLNLYMLTATEKMGLKLPHEYREYLEKEVDNFKTLQSRKSASSQKKIDRLLNSFVGKMPKAPVEANIFLRRALMSWLSRQLAKKGMTAEELANAFDGENILSAALPIPTTTELPKAITEESHVVPVAVDPKAHDLSEQQALVPEPETPFSHAERATKNKGMPISRGGKL